MSREKKILLSFSLYLLIFCIICLYGITHVSAQVINSSYLDTSANNTFWLIPNGYRQANSSLTVDSNSSEKYIVVDLCDSLYSSLSVTNVVSSSGNVTFYKNYSMNKSCQIDSNNTGNIDRLYFTVNSWADAGNGNYGVIFNSRLNSLVNYNSVVKVLNINTANIIDISDIISNNQDQIKDGLNNIQGSITDTENNLNNSIQNTEDNIIDNQDKNNDKVIENNDKNTDKIIEENNKNFQSCRDSVNLFNKDNILMLNGYFETSGNIIANNNNVVFYIKVDPNTQYTIHQGESNLSNHLLYVASTDEMPSIGTAIYNVYKINSLSNYTYTTNSTAKYLVFRIRVGDYTSGYLDSFQVEKGSSFTQYESYGQQVCTNKLDEQNKTSKGIWDTIKSFPSTFSNFFTDLGNKIGTFFSDLANKIGKFFDDLLTGIINGLKSLFIPDDEFFNDWFDDLKFSVEEQLGFLSTPITIFINFVNMYLTLSSANDIVINIPNITVPNFEDFIIIKAQTFNWSELIRSKTSFINMYNLYLDFVDVFLILNFLALCESTYNRIFGGDTSSYEYYTVDDSYNYDTDTGEVLGTARHSERKTLRKKVE